MEPTAGVAAANAPRCSSLPLVNSSRKEWRAVAEHQSAGNPGDEELEQAKLGQPDERTLHEVHQGRDPFDVYFSSNTMGAKIDNEILQQQVHNTARRRGELQRMEIELRSRIIARSEIVEMQNSYDAQIKEQASAASKLQEQLLEREQIIHELERKIEDIDRELHAMKLDNEAAWAKQDLLREQNRELASFRRERDHSEAERAQHVKQIHDLQEHIQEKEGQLIELQEQHRIAQETIIYKDEQLRDAQAWIARVREMDALQSTTNQKLQAELRERTEQYNQLWVGCQRQFEEMERLHMHTVQQLKLQLADARDRNGNCKESRMPENSKSNVSQFGQDSRNQLEIDGGSMQGGTRTVHPSENLENGSSFVATATVSNETEPIPGILVAPSSMLGMPYYLPPGQMALHPFVMHQNGVPHSVSSNLPQSQGGHFQSVPARSSLHQWQNQGAVSAEGSHILIQDGTPSCQTDSNLIGPYANLTYEMPVNGQVLHPNYLDGKIIQGEEPQSEISSSAREAQSLRSVDRGHAASQPEYSPQQITAQFHDTLRLDSLEQSREIKEQSVLSSTNHVAEDKVLTTEESSSSNASLSDVIHSGNHNEIVISVAGLTSIPTGGKVFEHELLDEKSLLACIVRTIPAGARIQISSTLLNRLGKMLAPRHWNAYKEKYGKLDDFLASHPELFVIDGDHIQLREGAQKMIAATAAVAKVAAAAAATSPYSSYLPSVAVTPVAQSHRMKVPSVDSMKVRPDKNFINGNSRKHVKQNQQSNGTSYSTIGGLSNIKILSKPKDFQEIDGSENRYAQSSLSLSVANGSNLDRSKTGNSGSIGSAIGSSAFCKQNSSTGSAYASRR